MFDFTQILAALAGFMGILMGFANIPQALKIYRTRSASDISMLTYGVLFVGYTVLLSYSIFLGNPVFIATNAFGLLGVGLVLAGIIRYEKRRIRHRGI